MSHNRSVRYFVILLIISLILLGADRLGILGLIKGAGSDTVSGGQEKTYTLWQNLTGFLRVFTYWKNGENKIISCQQRNRELIAQISQIKALQEENNSLKEQLKVDKTAAREYILAKIIAVKDRLKINKGDKDGIKTGMAVISGSYLVGKVSSTTNATAFIELPSSLHSAIEVVTSENRAKGILRGQANESLLLDSVLQTELLKTDDILLTSGENGQYPEGLIVGKIDRIIKNDAEVFQKAQVLPILPVETLKEVFVIKE